MKRIKSTLLELLFLLFGALVALIPTSPLNSPYANRDSGVFLYTGWRILNGEIPYIDVWDHKPPVVFFINALGLWLTNNSRWGVWAIEVVALFTAAYIGFVLSKKIFGSYAAIVSTFLWLFSFVFLISDGNLTEEYVLPLQFASLYVFYHAQQDKKGLSHYLLIGFMGGLAFFTKQTSIGIWLAIFTFLGFMSLRNRRNNNYIKEMLFVILGGMLVSIIIFGYFYINGAIYEFWDSAFFYNFRYSIQNEISLSTRLWNFIDVRYISKMGLIQIAALGISAFIFTKNYLGFGFNSGETPLLCVGLIDFPLELLLINIRGSTYEHYFIAILPVLALFSGLLPSLIVSRNSRIENRMNRNYLVLILTTIGLLALSGIRDYRNNRWSLQQNTNQEAIFYVLENTKPDDTILVWGAETMVNFYAQRNSPTRFVYQYPLYREGYTSEEIIIEFLNSIIEDKPQLIFNSRREEYPIFSFPIQTNIIQQKLDHIRSIYSKSAEVNSWEVYELSKNEQQ